MKKYHPPATFEEINDALGITGDESYPLNGELSPRATIIKTLAGLPEDARLVLFNERDLHFFTGLVLDCTVQMFFPACPVDKTLDVIFLSSDVWRKPEKKAMDIVAHELAHVFSETS